MAEDQRFQIGQRVKVLGLDRLGTITAVHLLVLEVTLDGGGRFPIQPVKAAKELRRVDP